MLPYDKDSSGRRICPAHVKEDVLTLIAGGASSSEVAAQFDITPKIIRKWRAAHKRKQAVQQVSHSSPNLSGAPSVSEQNAEIKKL